MREYNFSAGRRDLCTPGSVSSSHSSHPMLQRKRTLDEFPMNHSCQDTTRMVQERRAKQAQQRQNLVSTTGECRKLSSYSRRRFETALTIKDERSPTLPPPTPEERTLFWEEVQPTWTHRRLNSASAAPVAQPVQLTPRPGSVPAGYSVARGRPAFNHLRGNNRAYPTIRRLLQESNEGYRVVCPSPIETTCAASSTSSRRSSIDYNSFSIYGSNCLLVPREDLRRSPREGEDGKVQEAEDAGHEKDEDQLTTEMMQMARLEDMENEGDMDGLGEGEVKRRSRVSKQQRFTPDPKLAAKNDEDDDKEDDEDDPRSPWYCWVDDATVSSIGKDSEPEVSAVEVTPTPSVVPEVAVELTTSTIQEFQDKGKLSVPSGKGGKRTASTTDRKPTPSPEPNGKGKGKKKGGKRATPEPVEETVELPPPEPPVIEVVEEVKEVEEIPEPVLPSYICPSSVIKSSQTEIKLWLQKSTFSAANRFLPIY